MNKGGCINSHPLENQVQIISEIQSFASSALTVRFFPFSITI